MAHVALYDVVAAHTLQCAVAHVGEDSSAVCDWAWWLPAMLWGCSSALSVGCAAGRHDSTRCSSWSQQVLATKEYRYRVQLLLGVACTHWL